MLAQERQQHILDLLRTSSTIPVRLLREQLSVSNMTLWRDLERLESQGYLHRIHGGVVRNDEKISQNIIPSTYPLKPSLVSMGASKESHYKQKAAQNYQEKHAIQQFVTNHLIDDDDILGLDGGTTVTGILRQLQHRNLTILTNSLGVITEVAEQAIPVTLIASGGMFREAPQTFVGPTAEVFLRSHAVKKLFLSATGLTLEYGLTDPNPLDVQAKRAMMDAAEQVIALIDSSKFGVRSMASIASFEEIDVLITDSGAPRDMLDTIRRFDVEVHVVTP